MNAVCFQVTVISTVPDIDEGDNDDDDNDIDVRVMI